MEALPPPPLANMSPPPAMPLTLTALDLKPKSALGVSSVRMRGVPRPEPMEDVAVPGREAADELYLRRVGG